MATTTTRIYTRPTTVAGTYPPTTRAAVWLNSSPDRATMSLTKRTGVAELNVSALDTFTENPAHAQIGPMYQITGVLPVGLVTGRFMWTTRFNRNSATPAGEVYIRLAVFSADGLTLRGVLFEGIPNGPAATTTVQTGVFTGDFTPVTVQSGDILTFERGGRFTNAVQFSHSLDFPARDDDVIADLPAINGSTVQGNPWLDITVETLPTGRLVKRYYLPSSSSGGNSASVSPAQGSMWPAVSLNRYKLNETPSGTADTNRSVSETEAAGAYAWPGYQYVSEPLPAGWRIEKVRLVQHAANLTTGNVVSLAARIAVVSSDGLTVKREMYGSYGGASFTTPLSDYTARELNVQVDPYVTALNDRLVVEPGVYNQNATATSQGAGIRHGDPVAGSDTFPGSATISRPFFEITYAPDATTALATTRYYMPDNDNATATTPAITPAAAWFTQPSPTIRPYKRLTTPKPNLSIQGGTGSKPGTLPNSTLVRQLRTPALSAGTLNGYVRMVFSYAFIGISSLRCIIRQVASDGSTIKATVADISKNSPTSSTAKSLTLETALTGLTIASGDMLVFELGGAISSGLGGSCTIGGAGITSGVADPDWVYNDGITDTDHFVPWIEMIVDVPAATSKVHLGADSVSKMYLGSTQASAIYLGTNQVL